MAHLYDLHLDNIDWSSKIHERIVAASLVEGAYNMEYERHGNIKPYKEKAGATGARLGFKISTTLVDPEDGSYFATVFKFKYDVPNYSTSGVVPPKYVIAFKGTCLDPETFVRDAICNSAVVFQQLHMSRRYASALRAVEHIISKLGGPQNVWLAGHSLGSAIALAVGRSMVIEKGLHVKTFLFNPPFVALSNLKPLSDVYWYGRSILTAGTEILVRHLKSRDANNEFFDKLKTWMPNLFLNRSDYISNGYIDYFEQRTKMSMIGMPHIENIATRTSRISLFGELVGEHCEPIHLIPSANLTITESSRRYPIEAHGIQQWWQNWDLPIQNESHIFNNV